MMSDIDLLEREFQRRYKNCDETLKRFWKLGFQAGRASAIPSICADCDGEGLVCEYHPEVPWMGGEGCCGGAGMQCKCQIKY